MFFKFPRTPHLVWLGPGHPRGDKVLSQEERSLLLSGDLIIEEKVDGANIGISWSNGHIQVQNRGEYIRRPASEQFSPLWPWIESHRNKISFEVGGNLILFGEWCFAVHAVRYDSLPDWFLGFDVYDRTEAKFWSVNRRNSLLQRIGLSAVREIDRGHFDANQLIEIAATRRSTYTNGPLEGLYVRRESGPWLEQRAKIVRAEFSQSIQQHWSKGPIQRNRLRLAS